MPGSYMESAIKLTQAILSSVIVADDWIESVVVFFVEQLNKNDIITTEVIIILLDILTINQY